MSANEMVVELEMARWEHTQSLAQLWSAAPDRDFALVEGV